MMDIYGVPVSVHTRKVIVAAIAKGLPYRIEPVVPFDPPAGWGALSPTGKIPAIRDDGLSLADSSVICAYFERLHPAPPMYPADTRDYVSTLWFEEYADGTLFREVVHPLFFQIFIRPRILDQATDTTAVEATLGRDLPRVFGYLDRQLGDRYAAGAAFTVADIAIVSNLVNFQYLGFGLDGVRYPGLVAHFEKCVRHPAMLKALKAEQPVAVDMKLQREFLAAVLE